MTDTTGKMEPDGNVISKESKKIHEDTPAIEGSALLDVSMSAVLRALVEGYGRKGSDEDKSKFSTQLSTYLKQETSKYECAKNYNILVLFDNTIIVNGDADSIYQAINTFEDNKKPLLLILLSKGGEPGPAYLIGKLCRQSSNGKLVVAIPRYAKSAATLLATAADEIHMGSLSELGPIDPQIGGMPALGLKDSIEHITQLVSKVPESSGMFAQYLKHTVQPIQIGYYERAAKSAQQYAERLLEGHKSNLVLPPTEIASKLVYEYKDHGFVIDKAEAEEIFGTNTIKSNTSEYDLSNAIYNQLSEVERIADMLNYRFYFIGSLDSEPSLMKK